MKTIIAMALFTTALAVQASPISLAPLPDDASAQIVKTLNVYGTCGPAVVQVLGVAQDSFGPNKQSFSFDAPESAGVFVVADGEKPPAKIETSDHNIVMCVPLGKEFRLVVASACAGSACGDAMHYAVVDPRSGKTVSPKACDIACASKLIKSDVLKKKGLM